MQRAKLLHSITQHSQHHLKIKMLTLVPKFVFKIHIFKYN